jgi:hypothetical protein
LQNCKTANRQNPLKEHVANLAFGRLPTDCDEPERPAVPPATWIGRLVHWPREGNLRDGSFRNRGKLASSFDTEIETKEEDAGAPLSRLEWEARDWWLENSSPRRRRRSSCILENLRTDSGDSEDQPLEQVQSNQAAALQVPPL